MATVIKGSLLIAMVGVIVSGAVALAVSETKIGTMEEDIGTMGEDVEQNAEAINDIECTLSGMSADVRWIVVTIDDNSDALESIRRLLEDKQ